MSVALNDSLQQTQPVANGGTGAAASMMAVLPGAAGKLTYIEGFDVTGGGATAASIIAATVTGLLAAIGTLTYDINILAGVAGPMNAQGGFSVRFPEPLPAAALNSPITVTVPSFGSGNTNAAVVAYGFQR